MGNYGADDGIRVRQTDEAEEGSLVEQIRVLALVIFLKAFVLEKGSITMMNRPSSALPE